MAAILGDAVLEHKSVSVPSAENARRRAGVRALTAKSKQPGDREAMSCLRNFL